MNQQLSINKVDVTFLHLLVQCNKSKEILKVLIITLSSHHVKPCFLLHYLLFCIEAPFYPIEAENKGANPAEYGAVFGIIHLAMFLSGPIFGKFMWKLGVFPVFIFGVLGTAICGCLFGLLTYLPSAWTFLGCSYALR